MAFSSLFWAYCLLLRRLIATKSSGPTSSSKNIKRYLLKKAHKGVQYALKQKSEEIRSEIIERASNGVGDIEFKRVSFESKQSEAHGEMTG